MIVIVNFDATRFTANGLLFDKSFRSRQFTNGKIVLNNIFNNQELFEPVLFSQFEIDGSTYATVEETINALNFVIYSGVGGEVSLSDEFGESINIQNPLSVDGQAVYEKDIDFNCSEFINWAGDPTNLFKSPFSSSITNSSIDNPKEIVICFKRTLKAVQVALGENNGGDFSNVKISLLGPGVEISIFDGSTNNTKLTTLNAEFVSELFNSIKIEFFTNDPVSLSNITIFKATFNTSQLQGVDDLGQVKNVGVSRSGNLKVKLEEFQSDAFGRLRVSVPYTIFDSSLTTQINDTLFWSNLIGGIASVNYVQNSSHVVMNVSQLGDQVVRQTKQRFKYQPGKSHVVLITGYLPTSSQIVKRCGLLDYDNIALPTINGVAQNGIYFENNGTAGYLSWSIANNGIITESVIQDNWNIDKCDGNGPSGFLLDINSTNIFFIDLQWLGVGAVRCGFVADTGQIVICHQFQHASKGFSNVYMRTANLPVSYEITSAGGIGQMKAICSSVISEGGFNPKGVLRGLEMPNTGVTVVSNTKETLIGIRLKNDSFEYSVEINSIGILAESSGDGKWQLIFNPTLDGTPTWNDVPNSVIQQSITNIEVLDSGLIIASGVFSSDNDAISADVENALKIGKDLLGNLDEIWLVVEPFSTETMYGSMNLRELL